MNNQRHDHWTRREFLSTAALAGAGSILGLQSNSHTAEPPLETTRIRLVHGPSMCQAPQYIAEDLLRSEGFADVRYTKKDGVKGIEEALASGEADINLHFVAPLLLRVEAGDPVVILAGGTSGASSCSRMSGSARFAISRERPSACSS
jgi:NitT/TauT family transport system substrate-binding protein